MISLDGFRADYLQRNFAPTIRNLSECGTKARFMHPVFPSKTFPNHFSQVTGLYPETHGIIDNQMFDPEKGEEFVVGKLNILKPFWWQREPIWVTAVKQGKKSACLYWPGSEVAINGTHPTYYKTYSSKLSFEDRVDQVLRWLDMPPKSRPDFINMHFSQPDAAGHFFGPDSDEVNYALKIVDDVIARLVLGLQWRNLTGCVDMIISSDHGMSDVRCNRSINVENFVNITKCDYIFGSIGRIRPKANQSQTEMISKLQCRSEHMRAYAKEQLPVRFHFVDNARIEPIFIDMDARWTVINNGLEEEQKVCNGGTHGYDNLFPDMGALFVAYGPSFKQHYTSPPFINTELYEMLCELLDIVPNPNNGTKGSLHHMLNSPRLLPPQTEPNPPLTAEIPKEDMEYKFRVYAAYCPGYEVNKTKDMDEKTAREKRDLHMPFGIPFDAEDNSTLRLLLNEDYISAFDVKYRLPMWTSFTLHGQKNISEKDDIAWIGDPRISFMSTPQCTDYDSKPVKRLSILQRPLYSPNFSDPPVKEQAARVTNSIPKSLNHTNILEKELNDILRQKVEKEGQLNVVMGPAFDFSATGIRPHIGVIMRSHERTGPLVVPTHIFVVTTWCTEKVQKLKECNPTHLETLAYLLPNMPFPDNCEPGKSIIERNVARVVDVEKLTGISFFTGLPIYEAIRLRARMPDAQSIHK
ncbi:venom phosphodiesterase-like [Uloborus diversus]|uniref:venom phosphodiesterase-like n=1 Tax=Uloborus diversus TaxID=327109 RepID=UPI0024097754|nr:venom phosphodiesterase-like [Uloborus diversus]